MIIGSVHIVLNAEPRAVTGEFRAWGDMRENGKDEFVWEFENCRMGCDEIEVWSTGLT
jgi:hypothetical protein